MLAVKIYRYSQPEEYDDILMSNIRWRVKSMFLIRKGIYRTVDMKYTLLDTLHELFED